jgi:endonuclease/exonuclease/phosphatase family metal-dependent hydrolase
MILGESVMRRLAINALAVVVLFAGGWYVWNHRQIDTLGDAFNLASSQIQRLEMGGAPAGLAGATIRIGSFNIQAFGEQKIGDPVVVDYLAQIAREFDVLAIQELRGQDDAVLVRFLDRVNSTGRKFAAIASPPIGRNRYFERYAFLFDQEKLTLDDSHSYTVQDPDDLFHREPFVGWFRTAGIEPERAFTFSLVNVHLDSRQPHREVAFFSQLFRAIRADGRGEDDVIIAGDFNADPSQLQQLRERSGLICLIDGTPTNVRCTQGYDNLLIHPLATAEFNGRSGVFDFLKVYNLTIEQAASISDHLPVWAEFSTAEHHQHNLTAAEHRSTIK